MLLRRITDHVKGQNWTAIAIDFVIVVVGVFIGIQVSNWNASRLERIEEAAFVERLRADFERIEADAERSLAFHQGMAADLATLVRALRAGKLESEDVDAVERALQLGGAFQTSADRSGTFTELLSSGRASILQDKELLIELVAYEDFLERFDSARNYFIDMSLEMIVPYTAAFDYDVDAAFFTNDLELSLDHSVVADYDFDAMAADPSFHNAAEQLAFIHNLYTMWRRRILRRIDGIQSRLVETAP